MMSYGLGCLSAAQVIAFKTPISTLGVIGSSIAIFGTLTLIGDLNRRLKSET